MDASGRGRDKVLFGTNGLGLERCKREFLELDIREETKHAVLLRQCGRPLLQARRRLMANFSAKENSSGSDSSRPLSAAD